MRKMRKFKQLRNIFYCIILLFSVAPSALYIYPFQEFKFRFNTESSRKELKNKKTCADFLTVYFIQKEKNIRNSNLEMLLEQAFSKQINTQFLSQLKKRNRFFDVFLKLNVIKTIHYEDVEAGFLI